MIDELLGVNSLLIENHQSDTEQLADKLSDSQEEEISMGTGTIQLSGECTIYEIAQLHQKIHDNWKAGSGLELNAAEVSDVDASFIQLLAVCKNIAESNEQSFLLLNPSEVLNEKIDAMFMHDFFFAEDDKKGAESND